jgi:hypothetical protein
LKIFLASHRKKPVAVVINLHKMEARRLILEQPKWTAINPEEMAQAGSQSWSCKFLL